MKSNIRILVSTAGAALLLAICFSVQASAQDGRLSLNHLNRLYDGTVESVDVRIDAELLRVMAATRDANNDRQRGFNEALSRLQAVYVKAFRYDAPGGYADADLSDLRNQLSQPGWERVVTQKRRSGEIQEVYLFMRNGTTGGIAIISSAPRALSVVNVVGEISIRYFDMDDGLRGLSELDQNWSRWASRRGRNRH